MDGKEKEFNLKCQIAMIIYHIYFPAKNGVKNSFKSADEIIKLLKGEKNEK